MKIRYKPSLCTALLVVLTTGCVSTSSKIRYKDLELVLDKNLQVDSLTVTHDPVTGKTEIAVTKLKSDASTVIQSNGLANKAIIDASSAAGAAVAETILKAASTP